MATTTIKYVSLDKLTKYDAKIKDVIEAGDSAALDAAKLYADNLATNYDAAGSATTAAGQALNDAKDYADGKVNALANGQVKTNKDAIAAIRDDANIDSFADVVAALATKQGTGDYATKEEAKGYADAKDTAIAEAKQAGEDAQKTADDNAKDIATIGGKVDILIGADANMSVRAIANAELAAQLIPEDAQEALNTLTEIAAWIQSHPDDASEMNEAIVALQNKVNTGDKTVTAYVTAAIEALKIGDYAKVTDLNSLSGEVGALKTESAKHATKDELTGVSNALNEYKNAHANDYTNANIDKAIEDAIDAEEQRIDTEVAKKVDKVSGKGLSTNDLTDALKQNYDTAYTHSQAAHAPSNAERNVITGVKVNGSALTPTSRVVDITVPTDNAELTNGAGYLVAADIAGKADKATTLAGYGITDAYTKVQTDSAIAAAMAQFVEVTDDEINALFAEA